ncbi:centrosomal AT-AC splicing factor isoform X2 [Caloenas nicobarica]|uniref:centrosomal AT-AC splicing factor isoform X2 n=1 Tax=Caloenas nicobarica TaxID=187106 RepID=UPI0032B729D0
MAALHCGLCRRTFFVGRRHLYSAGHRRRLQEALARLQEEVAAAREAAAAGAVRPFAPAEDERRVWPEHRRATLRFWREQRAEAALRERVLVPAEEYERLERALARAVAAHRQREDERIQEMAAAIREAEHRQQETVRAALELQMEPELCTGPVCAPPAGPERDSSQDAEQPGPSGTQTGPNLTWMEPGQALTFIGHQEAEGKGNVHTGAKPPWLTEEEDESRKEIGPSYEEFLKQKEKQKLKKLPAERVGANFDHTSETGAGWLPSFGRVWNHGRRWQSRHQFRTESEEKKKKR